MPHAEANGIKLFYKTYGDGYPVILIGGLGSQIQSWATQIPIYSKHYKVIVFDNRGVGRSDKPDYPYTTEMMADDTVGLMDSLGIDQAHIVGKSMGGMIAQRMGIKYPDRINKIVMGCSSGSRDEVGNEILRIGRDITTKIGPKTGWLMALFLGYNREYIEDNLEQIKNTVETITENKEDITGYLNQSYACENHDCLDILQNLKAETLVMFGERDFITAPRRSQKLAELIPNSILREFKGVGHGFWRECQKDVDKLVLDFLREN